MYLLKRTCLKLCIVPPEVTVLNRRMSQTIGKETILNCVISASPQAEVYWKKGNKKMDTQYGKSRSEIYKDSTHTLTLSLQIIDIQKEDFGNYTCEASNKLGRDSESMILFGKISLFLNCFIIYSVASLIRIIHLSGHLFGNQSPFLNIK